MSDGTLAQYFRDVKKLLPCSTKEKQRCIDELEADVTAFLEHHPDASLTEIYDSIGSPESIAKSFMDRVSPNELSHKLSAKRKIVAGILAIAIVLATIVAVLVTVTANRCQDFYDGYYVETFDSAPDNADPSPSALSTY
jgi:hypothetical protein